MPPPHQIYMKALPPCSFKRGVGVTMTCDISKQNVTSLQWQVGGMMSEVYPYLTTCNLHGCDKQSYKDTHTFVATVQLDPTSTHIVSSSLKLPGDHFFSFFIGDYRCVPDNGQAIKICDYLNYVDDPTPPVCQYPTVEDDEVKIKCTIENVYPAPQCRLNITTNGQERDIATTTIVEHSQKVFNPHYMSFSAKCAVAIPLAELGVGNHAFQLVASVNFNDSEMVQVYSNNISFIVPTSSQKLKCLHPVINMTTEAIIVECYISYLYRGLECRLETFQNSIAFDVPANVTYIYDMALYQAEFILVYKCIHSVPLYNIGPGSFNFKVTMYNVINGTETNGTRMTGDFTSPIVLKIPIVKDLSQICPDDVSRLTRQQWHYCTCLLEEVGNPPGRLEWHTSDGLSYYTSYITGTVIDTRANRTFTCQAKTPIAENLPGVTWAPIFQDPPFISRFIADCEGPLKDYEEQIAPDEVVPYAAHVNTTVTILCQPEGTPLPSVVITKVGSDVPLIINGTSVVINITDCTDTLRIMCQVLNSTGSPVVSSLLDILVKCPIQLLNESVLPITLSKSGKDVELHLQFSGYPMPSTILLSRSTIKGPNSLIMFHDFVYNTWTNRKIISITLIRVRETANYTLTLGNGIGQLIDVNFSVSIEAETSDVNIGAIVGGVIGGILTILVVVVVLHYCISGLKRNRRSYQEIGAENTQI